jgi:type I restriction-modification system DNA methylase subunit
LPATIATFQSDLEKLIHKFEADQQHYSSKDYLEAQARMDLITPFFKALGWDVENEAGLLHHDREVLVEKGDLEATGRPDYNFRIGGQTRFYVEAKAPSEGLDTPRYILQAKGYVWNTKSVYFVILTNFEEFRFYDASAQPDPKRPEEGLLLSLRYSDYAANAEKLWEFSRERVAAGSLEALLPKIRRAPRLRKQVDDVFLDEMTGWREELAKNIHKNNPELTARQLNEVVQRLLDRIVFIRIAEDRKVLEYGQLRRVLEDWEIHGGKFHIFDWLNDLFHKVNDDFNGEIFKPHLSETIKIDSELLARIIKRLYPPESPYRFDVIGVELLGSIYERYLGNTIRLTPKQVKVEEKPEVRKAGGVYYTPRYIVDYIVRETVGRAIEGKSPKQIEKIRILDPACGSGSFLIGAFQYLIDYHVKWYLAHPEQEVRHAHPSLDFMREVHTDPDGAKRLSVYRKARILRNNLFGVDIDPQAVEITMMSLYLKALEGEQSQLPPKQHILPELKYNIMCGNSLIGPDIYDQGMLFAEDERDRINAFDWNFVPLRNAGFQPAPADAAGTAALRTPPVNAGATDDAPSEHRGGSRTAPTPRNGLPSIGEVMRSGGFDCVIGNPPYIRIQTLQQFSPEEANYLKAHYRTAISGNFDIYVCLVEKGLSVLNESGRLGFILPSKFFQTDYGIELRKILVDRRAVRKLVDFGHLQVFDGPTTYTCLMFLTNGPNKNVEYLQVQRERDLPSLQGTVSFVPFDTLSSESWVFGGKERRAIFQKMTDCAKPLQDLGVAISRGTSSGADGIFVVSKTNQSDVYRARDGEEVRLESGVLRTPLYATDFKRYAFAPATEERIIFPYSVGPQSSTLIAEKEFKSRFPRAYAYLRSRRKPLEDRQQFTHWYGFSAPRNLPLHDAANLLVPLLADRGSFSEFPAGQKEYCLMASGGFSITIPDDGPGSPKYVLGLLNSKLLFFYLHSISNVFRGGWITCTKQYVGRLPIRLVDFSSPADKARHDKMVKLVDRMLELNRQKHSGKLAPSQVERIDREIAATDAEIDGLVYELYGITEEERGIVEGMGP